MSQPEVYQGIKAYLGQYLCEISQWTLDRVTLLASGILQARHAAPARIAVASRAFSANGAQAESIERRLRRIENDANIRVESCFHPFVQAIVQQSTWQEILLILDPTTQEDRVVLVSLNLWYRGRALPLVWDFYPGNQPLEGPGLLERVDRLLQQAKALLPAGVAVTVLADRAFGIPSFVTAVERHGWHWIIRLKSNGHVRDQRGHDTTIAQLVQAPGQRRKLRGEIFKKAGWHPAYLAVLWGRRFPTPLSVASDRPLEWRLLLYYQRRFAIEPSFRDWKSAGWQWEQGQVTDLAHLQRLILGMALASWLSVLVGALQAGALLREPSSGRRHSRSWWGKFSLFQLGLQVWSLAFSLGLLPILLPSLPDANAPNWSAQVAAHHAKAFLCA